MQHLLSQLSLATTAEEARALCDKLVREHECRWVSIGGEGVANLGVVQITNDTARTSIERITNAHAAVLEREAEKLLLGGHPASALPDSPRSAATAWLGVTKGHISECDPQFVQGVTRGKSKDRGLVRGRVWVAYTEGRGRRWPNFWCRDTGLGIRPQNVGSTILSLLRGNKVRKRYTIGIYGMGATTTLKGSPDGTLILSRYAPELLNETEEDVVAITFVRLGVFDPSVRPTPNYEYLVDADGNVMSLPSSVATAWDVHRIASAQQSEERRTHKPVKWIRNASGDTTSFEAGTLVVHFNYDMGGMGKPIWTLGNSALKLVEGTLFDPTLPTEIYDLRNPDNLESNAKDSHRIRQSVGARARFMWDVGNTVEMYKSVTASFNADESGESRTESVRVEFWVRKPNIDTDGEWLSNKESRNFLPDHWNVLFTAGGGGQTIHVESEAFFNDPQHRLTLASLGKGLIVHVSLDTLSASAHYAVTMSNRASLSDGPTKYALIEAVREALRSDVDLKRINAARHQASVGKAVKDDKLQSMFSDRMRRLGSLDADMLNPNRKGLPREEEPEPIIPTLSGPERLEIENDTPMPLRPGSKVTLNLASDIPDGMLFTLRFDTYPAKILADQPKIIPSFVKGRSTVILHIRDDAGVGTEGTLFVQMYTKDRNPFVEVPWKITAKSLQPIKPGGNTHTRLLPAVPAIIPISKDMWESQTSRVWGADTVGEVHVTDTQVSVLVNIDHIRLTRALIRSRYSPEHINSLKQSFALDLGMTIHGLWKRKITDEGSLGAAYEAAIDVWVSNSVRQEQSTVDIAPIPASVPAEA